MRSAMGVTHSGDKAQFATTAAARARVRAVASHSCSRGYTHAHLPWGQKCLRRGQFCKGSRDRVYHRYGFHCHKRDARGNYHLT
jgi:hypothetical protein